MNFLRIVDETTVDGPGFRVSIYVSGCENYCEGCFNPESWDYNAGTKLTDEIINDIINLFKKNIMLEGISILGGDPFAPKNRKDLLYFIKRLYDANIKNIWVWTGYTKEKLDEDPIAKECFKYIDTLVDGPFILSKKDPDLIFRGSSNQRILKL